MSENLKKWVLPFMKFRKVSAVLTQLLQNHFKDKKKSSLYF